MLRVCHSIFAVENRTTRRWHRWKLAQGKAIHIQQSTLHKCTVNNIRNDPTTESENMNKSLLHSIDPQPLTHLQEPSYNMSWWLHILAQLNDLFRERYINLVHVWWIFGLGTSGSPVRKLVLHNNWNLSTSLDLSHEWSMEATSFLLDIVTDGALMIWNTICLVFWSPDSKIIKFIYRPFCCGELSAEQVVLFFCNV